LDATAEGAGVLLAHKLLALDDLKTGRLIAPFDLELKADRAFHFVCPKGTEGRPKVRAFHDWLLDEFRRIAPAAGRIAGSRGRNEAPR
jgi:LysR family glycine cleavage system transcriptional activator